MRVEGGLEKGDGGKGGEGRRGGGQQIDKLKLL